MKKHNLVLQTALAACFAVVATSASAVVALSPTVASIPVKYATELTVANATLTSLAGSLSVSFNPAWGVAAGNHLYVRVDLSNAKFAAALTAASLTDSSATGIVSLSAGGAAASSFVIFDVSDATQGVLLTDLLTLAPTTLTYVNPAQTANVTVNVYDSAAAANAGGVGLGGQLSDAYVTTAAALATTFTAATNTASVSASFKTFLANATTGTGAGATIQLGQVSTVVNAAGALKPASGAAVVAADLATAADLAVTGVFDAVGTTGNVFLDNVATCATGPGTNLTLNTAKTVATATGYAGVTLVPAKSFVCLVTNGTTAVPAQTVTGALSYTGVVAGATVPGASGTVGTILHDGTELQTPWFSTATGYVSRIFLTNSGSTAATISGYTILTETGNVCTPGTRPTSIPAGSMITIDAADLCSGFVGGASRAAAIITIEQPTTQIQGVYQIINPTTGAQMAYGMMRPGTN